MSMPESHSTLLKKAGFPIPSRAVLNDHERKSLDRYGYWLEALAYGTIEPVTPEQRHFVQVAMGEAEPITEFETTWVKYCEARAQHGTQSDPLTLADRFARLQTARVKATAVRDEYSARRSAILEQIRPQLDALDEEFSDRLSFADGEASRLETEVREAVLNAGASFRYSGITAQYYRGKTSWDNKGLTHYLETHPEIAQFRRIGKPYVALRFTPTDNTQQPPDQD